MQNSASREGRKLKEEDKNKKKMEKIRKKNNEMFCIFSILYVHVIA